MRIICQSTEDLITNLVHIKKSGDSLFQDAVRVSINSTEYNEACYEVILHVSAIVEMKKGGGYVLTFDTKCGYDDRTAGGQPEGTDRAHSIVSKIRDSGWEILPGVIEA